MEFGRLGCHVAFCFVNMPGRDVSEQALLTETALTAMGVRVYARRCDVRDREDVEQFVGETKQKLGGVHFLVNNAGIASDGALWRLSSEAWRRGAGHQRDRRLQLHPGRGTGLPGPALRQDRERQRASGRRPGFGVANYAASKAALLGLTRAAAVELGPANVNVNAVAPGFIRTERMAMLPPRSSNGPRRARSSAGWPNRRTSPTSISFLCSESARHITGQTIVVDGGLSLES